MTIPLQIMSKKLFLVLLKKIFLFKSNLLSDQISYCRKISIVLILLSYGLPGVAQLPRFETPSPNIPVKPPTTPSPVPIPIPVQPPPVPIPSPMPIPIPVQPPPVPIPSPMPIPIPVQPPPIPAPRPISDDASNPLPENVIPPVAIITPINGLVNVILDNRTATNITYEVIGDTSSRSLPGKSNVPLRNLRTPVNINFRRDDGGFLLVRLQIEPGNNTLILTLTETPDFSTDRSSLMIENNGQVFLN